MGKENVTRKIRYFDKYKVRSSLEMSNDCAVMLENIDSCQMYK